MSLPTKILSSDFLLQGIEYLVDPANRIIAIGIGIVIFLLIAKFIFKSIKRLVFIAVIIGILVYLGSKYFINAA